MSSVEKLEITSPIGDLVMYLKDGEKTHFLSEGKNDSFGLGVSVSCEDVTSDLLKKIHYDVDAVYLLNFELTAKADVSGLQICFDLEDVIDSNKKFSELETGQFFDAVYWGADNYSAHLGFRNTVDEPFVDNVDFNDFKLFVPEEFHQGIALTIPPMKSGNNLSFPSAFAWAKTGFDNDDNMATNMAVDVALPMPNTKD